MDRGVDGKFSQSEVSGKKFMGFFVFFFFFAIMPTTSIG